MKHLSCLLAVLVVSSAATLPSLLHAQNSLRINEFMAINNTGLDDEGGNEEDWIELKNTGTTTVSLEGWFLTDKTNNLTKWRFPATNVPPGGFLVVFASEQDRQRPGAPLHTNFKLDGNGEYLALVQPDGMTIASEFRPTYPPQVGDVSYGFSRGSAQVALVPVGATARALVPANDALEPPPGSPVGTLRPWTVAGVDETGWQNGTTGVGYETSSGYESLLGLNVTGMQNVNQTVYIRMLFNVSDPTELETLTLWMQYDDGFIAYLNGREIAFGNAPDPSVATWNSAALADRSDGTAVVPQEFNVTAFLGFLHVGVNVLAIQGLNNGVGSSDLLVLPELVATTKDTSESALRYFPQPTPGQPNNPGVDVLGPILTDATHTPLVPTATDSILVTARIRPAFGSFASASLRYRVMYNTELELPFLDDGLHGDGLAGDGLFGATIPGSIATAGQMVRWYISASDTAAVTSRLPSYVDPLNSPQYFGTVVYDPALTNPLPVLHTFLQNPGAADNDTGTRCSLAFLDQFYDNCYINLHGQSSRGFPKKSYDIDFHPGHNFRWQEGEMRVDDINLLTTYPDKAHMRNVLAYETYRDAGSPDHFVVPVRVQRNAAFWGDAHIVENGDDNWLERHGLDINGAFYKMYNTFMDASHVTSGAEKKTRQSEDNSDLQALYNGVRTLSGVARLRYIYDNLDIPQMINFLAARIITSDKDCCHKNYYFYRDTEGTGEWQAFAWDVDLSFGRNWISSLTYWDQVLYSNNPLNVGNNNGVFSPLLGTVDTPVFRQMYLRRIRTLMDELLQSTNTPPEELKYERRVNELLNQIRPDAELDAVQWPASDTWGNGSATATTFRQSITEAANEITQSWLPARRNFMFNTLTVTGGGEIPLAQPADAEVRIGEVEYNPASGNQAQEYLQITNINSYVVDISGWRIEGGIDHEFKPGTVLPAFGVLYLAQDVRAFRARTTGPRGGQALFIQGNFRGQLSARGETLRLVAPGDRLVQTYAYPGNPSLAQQFLRITEIMYNPAPLAGNTNDAQAFEYVQLKNVGSGPLDLTGVRLTNGIYFDFTGSAVTSLAAGEVVLVVKSLAAFTARYGSGFNIAGEFGANLDNAGERLRLVDVMGEEILDFDYNNSWYPLTDGLGFSLVVVDELAEPDLWTRKSQWRWSGQVHGQPGQAVPTFPVIAPVLVNEALTHTDLPAVDAVELFNPNATNVAIGGWFLSDDFATPKKYRMADGTVIPAGGFLVFDESQFNPTPATSTSFAFGSDGDEVYLFSGDATTNLTGYVHGFGFGAAANGVSFGRHVTSVGEEHFVAQDGVTLSNANAGPLIGPVVLSEIMYHPPDELVNGVLTDNGRDEFLELHNLSAEAVPLYDPAHSTNTWRLQDAVAFTFPTNVSLPAGGHLVVVGFALTNATELAAFRARYQMAPEVPIYGPWDGKLNNATDSVELMRPDAPNLLAGGAVPYILVERVTYSDQVPWPGAADGIGPSMHRITATAYGNEPTNWVAAAPTPAAAFGGGDIPVVTAQPADQTVMELVTVTFEVAVEGTGPFTYLWRHNGVTLPNASASSLVLPNVQIGNAGVYSVVVLGSAGAVLSSNATLTVLRLPRILTPPQDHAVDPGVAVTFSVVAVGTGNLTYQWRRNGEPIANATEATYTVTDPQLDVNDGFYSVVVADEVGPRESPPAQLIVKVRPVITQQFELVPNPVLEGRSFTATISASGTLPMGFRFRAPGAPYFAVPVLTNTHTAMLTVENVKSNLHAGNWDVGITNIKGSALSARIALVVEPAAPFFALHPASQAVPAAADVTLDSEARGSDPISYQWYFNETNALTDATNASLTLSHLQAETTGAYTVVATNELGAVTSLVASVTLASGPQITVQPTNQAVTPCEPATFRVTATSALSLSYQWFFNETNLLTAATADTLTIDPPRPADAGAYFVVVSDGSGAVTSQVATLSLVLDDCDGDGMPDAWEMAHGLNPADANDRDVDSDNDGQTNWEEAHAGTDPRNAASVLKVRLVNGGNGGALIEFTAMPDVPYTIEYTRQLGSGLWISLTNIAPQASALPFQIADPDAGADGGRYYRAVAR